MKFNTKAAVDYFGPPDKERALPGVHRQHVLANNAVVSR